MHILEKQKAHIAQDVLSKIQNVMWKILKSVIQQVNKIGNRTLSEPFSPARQKGNGVWIEQISAMNRSPCRWNEGVCALTIWQRLRKFLAMDFPTVRKSIQFTCFHCIGVGVVIFTKNYFASSFCTFSSVVPWSQVNEEPQTTSICLSHFKSSWSQMPRILAQFTKLRRTSSIDKVGVGGFCIKHTWSPWHLDGLSVKLLFFWPVNKIVLIFLEGTFS